jgi:L-ascorbate metabolism protein UlaG (beta-lactamase superfamily)
MKSLFQVALYILLVGGLFISGCARSTPTPALTSAPPASTLKYGSLKIKWLGHSAFLVTSDTGIRIITDPYTPSGRLTYGEIGESADIVTVSHAHSDHNNVGAVRGNPEVVRATAEVKGIKFKAISTFHDDSQGRERGANTVFSFEVSGIRICHLGDLGHLLADQQVSEIGRVDILLIPVGGNYTIDAAMASQICDRLKPSVIIPMHYKTDKCDLPIVGVDEFLQGKSEVTRLNTSEVEFKSGQLPVSTQIVVLKSAL